MRNIDFYGECFMKSLKVQRRNAYKWNRVKVGRSNDYVFWTEHFWGNLKISLLETLSRDKVYKIYQHYWSVWNQFRTSTKKAVRDQEKNIASRMLNVAVYVLEYINIKTKLRPSTTDYISMKEQI